MSDVAATLRRLGEQLHGCLGAFTMDYDGLPMEVARPGGLGGPDLDAIGAELGAVLREAQQAGMDLGLGALRAASVRTEGPTMVFQACGQDSLLAVVLDRISSAPVARRALAENARQELAAL